VVGAEKKATAARIQALDGLRLGILDNTKWNANKLLRELRDQLQAAHPLADVHYYRKESFSRFADPALIETIRKENDIVVTAIGD
jgi:rRNA-processing protein FCF1